MPDSAKWEGPTYYGRPQLKAAPFNSWVVGGYIFLAGLSGGAALIAAMADLAQGRAAAATVRRGRYLSLLAPSLGSLLLIWDLHTPKRFYNMFRVAKKTSPMSIGTWILTAFSLSAVGTAALQFLADHAPRRPWLRRLARVAQVPAALSGAGLGTYTASLLSATSTPLWAAAAKPMAARFAASSVASGAAMLAVLERGRRRRKLDTLLLAALAAELGASAASDREVRRRGIEAAGESGWGQVERVGATGLGNAAPLALQMGSLTLAGARPGLASDIACLLTLAGSLLLRISILGAGGSSATRPEISLRYAQPDNLP